MNKPMKAALLSALIFPGVGQISIGHKKRGWFIIFMNGILLYMMISEIIKQASNLVEKMQKSGVALDYESISNKTSDLVSFSDNSSLNILLMLLIFSWIASVIDAYILGGKITQ